MSMIRTYILIVAALLLAGAFAFGGYRYSLALKEIAAGKAELAQVQETAANTQALLEAEIAQKTDKNTELEGLLRTEQKKNGYFEEQLSDLSGTVGTLEKLAKTDPELLAKYSKVYFLNENYAPPALSKIPDEYAFQEGRTYELHAEVEPHLRDLLDEATEDGLSLKVASAYRSFSTQSSLKSGYQVRYGSGANAFSADQGYSEHQLGTTVDLTTMEVGGMFVGFDETEEFEWLKDNAWRYGFILSYPKGNGYYQYEPWHWRFVGRDLAERLHEDDGVFYDLDQRTIDTYLAGLFD